MARHRVEGLDLTPVALGCAGIQLDDTLYTSSGQGLSAWEDITLYDASYPHGQPSASFFEYPVGGFGGSGPGLLKPDVCTYTNTVLTTTNSGAYSDFSGTSAATPQLGGGMLLVPLLVFFFLKDKDQLIKWLVSYLPTERPFISRVVSEMDDQISNYVRGKAMEILITGGVTYIVFVILGVNYAALLGLLVGLSVVVPYIGATVVTIPVAVVAYLQFGTGSEFMWVMIAYGIIQALDGNVLVPILFSEAVNLHPVAIIVAVLVFGGFWGLWGVFFAIPLATLVKAILSAWPKELPHTIQEAREEARTSS